MVRKLLPALTRVEWDLMNAIWRGGGSTVADLHARFLDQRGWSHNTVKTMMQRLVKKGYLHCDSTQKAHVYTPAAQRGQVAKAALAETLDRILEQGFGPLVAYAADRKKLTQEEIARLKEILKEGDAND